MHPGWFTMVWKIALSYAVTMIFTDLRLDTRLERPRDRAEVAGSPNTTTIAPSCSRSAARVSAGLIPRYLLRCRTRKVRSVSLCTASNHGTGTVIAVDRPGDCVTNYVTGRYLHGKRLFARRKRSICRGCPCTPAVHTWLLARSLLNQACL